MYKPTSNRDICGPFIAGRSTELLKNTGSVMAEPEKAKK
jgi:hypothetical protein